eukprot:CAMPEP_0170560628 /NCGR_PEP_ID=MMETSP0211-20121228/50006_1 /TAXON_ID=311385 /ORGANISM="Pseudokeronopsis sp., Strain OXSARD2" /LENGTH=84 /DNA_ID=CAMNT_0010875059 /DNA_START=120 /DNA_END=374 /DNA_ORIENTATION=+
MEINFDEVEEFNAILEDESEKDEVISLVDALTQKEDEFVWLLSKKGGKKTNQEIKKGMSQKGKDEEEKKSSLDPSSNNKSNKTN